MTRSRWIGAVLVVSLVINLVLVGYLVGQSSHPRIGGDPTRVFPRWVRTLPESRQDTLRPLVREHVRAIRQPLRGMRRQHNELQDAIKAEPFDAQTLSEVLKQMRDHNQLVQQNSHAAFVEFVSQLTQAERQALIKDIRAPKPPRWHKGGRPQ